MAEPFDPTRYTDEYRANLMRIIKAKMKGKKPNMVRSNRSLELDRNVDESECQRALPDCGHPNLQFRVSYRRIA